MRLPMYFGPQADTRFYDGGLPMLNGVFCQQVIRANRGYSEFSREPGFTYNHAPMLCRYRGYFYLLYLTSPVHEHGGFACAMLTRSESGLSWSVPKVAFPDLPVPGGVYCGPDADAVRAEERTVVHHRMAFYLAKNGVLLVMTHHGVSPKPHSGPNTGYGMGRTVRRIFPDGTLGDIFVLRVNTEAGWKMEHFPYPWFEESGDAAFAEACRDVIADRAANAAWWEEERLNTGFFPLTGIKAPSLVTLPDGNLMAIGKNGLCSVSGDGGESWTKPKVAEGIITSGGKCLSVRTGDGRYAILYNPSADGQHRWPLAAITSDDGYEYRNMACVSGDVAPMRYGGYLKNFGLNYIRGIMPGNDDAPDRYTWVTFSMNKEDIWIARLSESLTSDVKEDVDDDFSKMSSAIPNEWNIYSLLWSPVRVTDGALEIRTGEPADCARASRNFPVSERVRLEIEIVLESAENGRLRMEATDRKGMPIVRLALEADGSIRFRAGNGEWPVGTWENGVIMRFTLELDALAQRVCLFVNGVETRRDPMMCPATEAARLTIRTGDTLPGYTVDDNLKNVCFADLPATEERHSEAVYRILSFRATRRK